jgi:prolipoprotein diacylglyceryltransferase
VLFYKPLYYFEHPLEIFSVWQGGMSFHGGFLGVLVALYVLRALAAQALARRHRFRRDRSYRSVLLRDVSAISSTASSGGA